MVIDLNKIICYHNNKEYCVYYENKRIKTKRLRINSEGLILVSGYNLSISDIEDFVCKYSDWIDKTIEKLNKKKSDACYTDVSSFNSIWILGKVYKLTSGDQYIQNENEFIYPSNVDRKKAYIKIRDSYIQYIIERVKYFSNIFKIYPDLEFKDMKSRFGYCLYQKNKIVLSKRLIHYTKEEIDYVIVHEFCHFYVPNHSKSFYDCVVKVLPDYKKQVKSLKKFSYLCKY